VRLLREELAQSQRSLVLANQLRERTADDLVALRDQVRQLTEERDRLAAERARGDAASAAELERVRATLKEERRQFVAERARLVEDMRQAALEEGRRAGLE
jgi:septal ring factor EnvC (AmiA/AmiB activator)